MLATSMGTSVMAAPTPNKSQLLSWNVAIRIPGPADVPTSGKEEQQSQLAQAPGLAGVDMDHRMGGPSSDGAQNKATIDASRQSRKENDRPSEKEMLSFSRKSTPSTMPRAMGKKSVSDSCLVSLPSRCHFLMPSFRPPPSACRRISV